MGAAERKRLLTGKDIRAGDVLLGLPSNGLHTNGYSLARKLLFEVAGYGPNTLLPEVGSTVGDALLARASQLPEAHPRAAGAGLLHGAAHITGGGITDNTPRILPKGMGVVIDTSAWTVPPLFELLRRIGQHTGRGFPAHFQPGYRHDSGGASRGLCRAPRPACAN